MRAIWIVVPCMMSCLQPVVSEDGTGGGSGDAAGGGSATGGGIGGGGSSSAGGGSAQTPADGGPCLTTYTAEIVAQDSQGGIAFRPECGNSRCQPIVTSGHFPPDYTAPTSTCDELPQMTLDQCGLQPTCACLQPLLQSFNVWPPSRWNCYWICASAADGGVDLLRCSLP